MNLKKFDFVKENKNGGAFSTVRTNPQLLKESIERGFYNGNTKFNKLFSELFFDGGKLHFKNDIDPDFKQKCTIYLKSLMSSFEPKQEEKESVSAMLLSELVV